MKWTTAAQDGRLHVTAEELLVNRAANEPSHMCLPVSYATMRLDLAETPSSASEVTHPAVSTGGKPQKGCSLATVHPVASCPCTMSLERVMAQSGADSPLLGKQIR